MSTKGYGWFRKFRKAVISYEANSILLTRNTLGDSRSHSSGATVNLRFPGQYFDMESGLYCNYFRFYDPQSGRYITSDPIGLGGGLNTYGYVYGNPLNAIDPDGKNPITFG